MQTKSKIILYTLLLVFTFALKLAADEFEISASEISIDKEKNIVIGIGSVELTEQEE